jgi:hypothetical protein
MYRAIENDEVIARAQRLQFSTKPGAGHEHRLVDITQLIMRGKEIQPLDCGSVTDDDAIKICLSNDVPSESLLDFKIRVSQLVSSVHLRVKIANEYSPWLSISAG